MSALRSNCERSFHSRLTSSIITRCCILLTIECVPKHLSIHRIPRADAWELLHVCDLASRVLLGLVLGIDIDKLEVALSVLDNLSSLGKHVE